MWSFCSPRPFLANQPRLWRNWARKGASRPLCSPNFGNDKDPDGTFCRGLRVESPTAPDLTMTVPECVN